MHNIIRYILLPAALATSLAANAQYRDPSQARPVAGVVLDADNLSPLEAVQLSSSDAVNAAVTGPDGKFNIRVFSYGAALTAVKDGYFTRSIELLHRDSVVVYMQAAVSTQAAWRYPVPDGEYLMSERYSPAQGIDRKDISPGYFSASDAMTGRLAGLRVTNKSGMPGEGSLLNLHGIRSVLGQNMPLIVVDGIPYMPDHRLSNITGGYSSDILEPVNLKNVEQITLLRGAEALPYGSLSSNGVLMIETQKGLVSQTQVEFQSVEGVALIDRSIPLMRSSDFRKYMSDIAGSRYSDSEQIVAAFPFLGNSMTAAQRYRYSFDTDWQKEIYSPAFQSENLLKVRGGDAVVKFMLTAGYQISDGVVDGTTRSKFYTSGNTDINFSDKLTAFASVSFDFLQSSLQEQGLSPQTNPLLAAYSHSPMTSVNQIDDSGIMIPMLAGIDPVMQVSNPAAILSQIEAQNKIYDILVNTGVNYEFNKNWKASLGFGIYYNYIKDDIFIGGKTSGAIAPLMGGLALNTVRSGSSEAADYYGKAAISYDRRNTCGHNLSFDAGWQLITSRLESSSGAGINTASDRYHNLTNVDKSLGRSTGGYAEVWNWMDVYATAAYNYKHQLYLSATALSDAASTYGTGSGRWFFFPAAQAGWKISNAPFLRERGWLSNLMLRAEWSVNPNSRYNSRYGSYYYVLKMLRDVSGLVREGVPNPKIGPERVVNTNLGLDFSTRGDKLTLSVDVFEENTRDMVIASDASSVYGTNYIYRNDGGVRTRGIDLSASVLLTGGKFRWRVGGNVSMSAGEVTDLGGAREQLITLQDGVTLINRVGERPMSYYGHRASGVYSSSADALADSHNTVSGYAFTGGDVRFNDRDGGGVIDDSDREILGDATPDLFGGIYTQMSWNGFSLFVNCAYSYGGELYNGVRRYNESGNGFTNQAASMARRWVVDGQQTDIPRVVFGDPAGNNRFSSRWIEDGSYLKVKQITLSWQTRGKTGFLNGMRVYVTGENLFCLTDYTGMDPEFAYSYDAETLGMDLAKVPVPKFVKAGVVLNF